MHIVPEWYYLPFYAILRAVPNKLGGVALLGASIVILAFLPWLDRSKVRSARYRPRYRFFFWLFFITCVGLGWLGSKPAEGVYVYAARALTIYYFAHFLVILPLLGRYETTLSLPSSITESVLKRSKAAAVIVFALLFTGLVGFSSPTVAAEADTPAKLKWSFGGPFGKFDQGQLQRGFRVYREVCQVCHGLNLLSFRNLADPGGPGFSPAQAAAVAAEYQVQGEPDDQGEVKDRPGRLADRFPPPFKNDNQARARYNAVPPDLSVIAKARGFDRGFPLFLLDLVTGYQEQGSDYLVALLTGYTDPPKDANAPTGTFYNKYFPGHFLAMPPPLSDGRVEYTDGTKPTADQLARDVTAFLAWAAEPHMEARKRIGLQVIIFLIIFSGLLYFTKKKVWKSVEAH
jgi:ubiquinol-cytochrome c reductase cytochrome b/c1 subunit